jgi:hypothetical protein
MSVLARFFRRGPDAEKVLADYGIVLGTRAPQPGYVADAKLLPHPKPRIKEALVVALRSMQDPHMRSQLRKAYVSLADWQEGVGTTRPGGLWMMQVQAEQDRLKSELQKLDL